MHTVNVSTGKLTVASSDGSRQIFELVATVTKRQQPISSFEENPAEYL